MKGRNPRVATLLTMLLLTAALLMSCGGHSLVSRESSEEIVWPPSSSTPRIAYVGSVSRPEDLDISQGLLGVLKAAAIGKEDTSMVHPMAVTTNGENQLYVADSGKKGIHWFDTERGKYHFVRRADNGEFVSPVGMAVDSVGNVYITDSELAKVFVIHAGEDKAVPLPLAEDFIRPTGIAVDKKTGWIYVVDTGIHAVYVFRQDKSLIKKFGHRGTQEGEFNFPTYIWQNENGDLLVTDSLNFRIQIFDRYGGYLNQFGSAGNGTGDQARSKGVAEDRQGHVYVTDSLFHAVQIFDEQGQFLLNFGEQGSGPGQFWLPTGIHISPNGRIYVADSYNKRVQIFSYIGIQQ